jgi:hypothetical protein
LVASDGVPVKVPGCVAGNGGLAGDPKIPVTSVLATPLIPAAGVIGVC